MKLKKIFGVSVVTVLLCLTAICGADENITLNDSGIVGMDAAKDYFSKFKTLSEADVK